MASIYPPRFRAKDGNGDPVSGAGLWVFETGTTTPAPIFTDAGLSISAPNPLTSDASGYFPQFFIAAQSVVDLQVRATTSLSSTLLWQATDIDSLGADDATVLIRDFGNNGRWRVRGSSGIVQQEAGDPDGDDIGGQMRVGGWNGTTGDLLELDFSDIRFPINAFATVAAFQTLTDAATINWDASLGFNARVTLGGNRTFAAPTNLRDGLTYALEIAQDGTGSRTVTWDAVFEWGNIGAPTLSNGPNKVDFAFGIYSSATGKLHMNFRRAAA